MTESEVADGDLRQGQSRQLEVVGSGGLRQRERWRYSLRFETVAFLSQRERWS